MPIKTIFAAFILSALASLRCDAVEPLALNLDDHISLIGNGLADRMQHDGWLETLIQARFPDKQLSIRNLGFAGDELTVRMRCENFGSPDDWLTRTKTDVVFAFFGYNESFAGAAGLDKFKQDLGKFIKDTSEHNYSGRGTAKLVLFSPIAHENLHDPNLPDGTANNSNLKLYTQAMAQVAKEKGVLFVDLFNPSLEISTPTSLPDELMTGPRFTGADQFE
jgi:hypothetical protein